MAEKNANIFDGLNIRDLPTLRAARGELLDQLDEHEANIKSRIYDIGVTVRPIVKVLDFFIPKSKNMSSTLGLNNQNKSKNQDPDFVSLAVDIVVPFLLDNVFFKGTKGRIVKLVGTVAAQQLIKVIARSKAIDVALDLVENWVKKDTYKTVEPYPEMNEAVMQTTKKPLWNRSKPEDYYDPEREMFY